MNKKRGREPRLPYEPFKYFLQEFARRLGKYGDSATYETLGMIFGVESSTITQWMKGLSPSREKARIVIDHAWQNASEDLKRDLPSKVDFLVAAGHVPEVVDLDENEEYDELLESLKKFGRILDPSEAFNFGGVPCGAEQDREQRPEQLTHHLQVDFFLTVEGDSMEPVFPVGTTLGIKRSEVGIPHEPNILLIDGYSTCANLENVTFENGKMVYIFSKENGQYEEFKVEAERVRFQGVVLAAWDKSLKLFKEYRHMLKEQDRLKKENDELRAELERLKGRI